MSRNQPEPAPDAALSRPTSPAMPQLQPETALSASASTFIPADPTKLHTVVFADHAHLLLLVNPSQRSSHSLPAVRLEPGDDLPAQLLACITATLGHFPSGWGDVACHRRMALTDEACVHHVFVPPKGFSLHSLRQTLSRTMQVSDVDCTLALVPWSAPLQPTIRLDRHANSLYHLLKPHLSRLKDDVRIPVCPLLRCNPKPPAYASVVLAITRRSRNRDQILMQVCQGKLRLPTVEPTSLESPHESAIRLISRHFADPRSVSRALQKASSWLGQSEDTRSLCYHSATARPVVTASLACHWIWAPASSAQTVSMTPAERKAVAAALREARGTVRRPQRPVTPAHVLTTPVRWAEHLYRRNCDARPCDFPPVAPQLRTTLLTPVMEDEARTVAATSFADMQRLTNGDVQFDQHLLDRLVHASCDRARSRGTLTVTARDVREAAQTLIETRRRSDAKDDSPADAIPEHYDTILRQLRSFREDTDTTKLGGGSSRAARVLIVGETSGTISRMFREAGADVATCDLNPSTSDSPDTPHFQGDASHIQDLGWDLVICHPPCTYLSNAGVQYLHTEPGRFDRMLEGVAQFKRQHATKAPFVCLEQPKLHGYARQELGGLQPTQHIHPWQHGTGQTKPTALYLSESLPPLIPTHVVPGRERALARLPNSVTRGDRRSRTFLGIAAAMALQWTPLINLYAAAHPDKHTAESLVSSANASLIAEPRRSPRVAAVRTYAIDEDTPLDPPQDLGMRPWELPRPAAPIPTLPIVRLRRTYGKWRALEPSGPAGRLSGYRWQPLLPAEHSTIDEITHRPRQPIASASLSALLSGVSTRLNQLPRWRQSATHLTFQLDQQTQQRKNAQADEASARNPAPTSQRQTRRPPAQSYPGLRTQGEAPAPLSPSCRSAAEYRDDYRLRFVKASPPNVVVASAPLRPSDLPPTVTSGVAGTTTFLEKDIIKPPPALPFVTNAAYLADFAVATHAGTRGGSDTMFSIGRAACAINESIGDTGAGPSIIGSAILARLPADAAVSRSSSHATVNEDLVGPDGNPLISRGTVTLVFALSGHPFRHDFLVVEGGDLLLLGNDFLARYRATVEPFGKDGSGAMRLQVTHRGRRRHLAIPLSCAASSLPAVSAPVRLKRRCCPVAFKAPNDDATGPSDEILTSEHPALVPLDDPVSTPPVSDPTTAVSPLEHVTSQTVTDEYLLYSKSAITLAARTEVTVWLPMPLAHREHTDTILVDRIPAAHGLEPGVPVACSLSKPNAEGLVPVRLINVLHRATTIPASAPVARCLIDYEVKAPGALDPGSGDAYERLSADQRATIDSIAVDEHSRLTPEQRLRVRALLAKHIRAFAMNPKDPAHTHLLEVELPLIEGAKPHRHAAARHGEAGQAIVDAHVAEMEANGIIRKSNSPWGSRVVLVKKKSGETRFCIDFRDLNSKLLTLDSPIPRCDEAIDRLASGAGAQDSLFLSTIDLAAGFWTLPIKESDKARTAFVTHRQKYEWNYLPFGVQSGPSYMCRLMDAALQGLAWEVCMPYLDDVGVWSTGVGPTIETREAASFEQMLTRLDLVLERLAWAGMTAKASKCVLFATSAAYLGHIISRKGLEMEPAKIQKILDIDPKSINTLERVRSFVGLCSYYRRFVKGFASITAPLADLTKAGVDVATESQKPEAQQAVITLIDLMTTEPVILSMPRFDRLFMVKTDAAQTEGLGGVLTQEDDAGHERVVCYYGRRLTKHERNYTVTEIELLAAIESIRTWRPYLWGRRFLLIIDHAALRWLHTMKDTIEGGPASRLMRWNMKLMEYNFEVMHKPGKIHCDADAVSRLVASLTKITSAARATTPPLLPPQPSPPFDIRAVKVAFFDPMTMMTYCRHKPNGGLDLPGGKQAPSDRSTASALLRECDEEVTLPQTLWDRLQVAAFASSTPHECEYVDRRGLTHRVSLWMVPATPAELKDVRMTPAGQAEGHKTAIRSLEDIALISPYREAIHAGLFAATRPRFRARPTAPTVQATLAAVRVSLQEWSASSGASEDHHETIRTGVTAACWEPTGSLTCAPAAQAKKASVTTAKSLLAADRTLRLADATRGTIIDSYVTTETPTTAALLEAQANDPDCATLRSYFATGSIGPIVDRALHKRATWAAREARHLRIGENGLVQRVDPSQPPRTPSRPAPSSSPKPFIPVELRPAYLYAFHEQLGHIGSVAMLKVVRRHVYWPGMATDVQNHVRSCHECSAARAVHRAHSHPVRPTVGSYPFDSVVCDACDMVESHDGSYTKILVFVDSLSRWIEVIPFKGDPTAEQVLDVFTSHVACRYGWPRELRSDGGSNLANQLASAIHSRTGVQLLKGAAYHPQSQGVAERVQGTLVRMCVAADEGGSYWPDHLPFLLFSYRATPHRVTDQSPASVLYGRELRLPLALESPESLPPVADLPEAIRTYAQRQHLLLTAAWQCAGDATRVEQERAYQDAYAKLTLRDDPDSPAFAEGDLVRYLMPPSNANKLTSAWSTPCRILEPLGSGNYRLRDLPNNMLDDVFHVSRLRAHPATADSEPLAADEYIVDRITGHRGNRPPSRTYKVKWRQYPASAATWEPREALLLRCAEMISAYDLANPPEPEPPTPRGPKPAKSAAIPVPLSHPTPPSTSSVPSADLPHRAMFAKGRWKYARYISTTRGMSERLFDQSAFPHAVLESQHFASLRSDALNTLPKSTAAVVAAVVASSPAAIATPPLPYVRPDAALPLSSGDLRAEDPIERGRSITQASALCNSASLPKSPSPLQRLAAVVASDRQAYRRHADVVVLHHTPTVMPVVVLYHTPTVMPAPGGAPKKPVPPSIEAIHVVHDLLDALVESPDLPPTAVTAAVAHVCGIIRPLVSTHRAIAACAYRAVHIALYGYDCKSAGVPDHLHASKRTLIAWRVALSLVLPAAMRSRARATSCPTVPPLRPARADAVRLSLHALADAALAESLSANPLHMLANAALADPEPHLVDQFHALAKARRPTRTAAISLRPGPSYRTIETEVGADPSEASVAAARHLLTEIGRFRSLPPPRLTVTLAAAVGYQNTGNPTSLANRHRAIAAAAYHALFLNIYGRTLNVTPPRFASSHGYAAALLRRWMRILHKPLLAALEHDL